MTDTEYKAKTNQPYHSRNKRVNDLYSKKPVRRGIYYCSPWCGSRCKLVDFDAAGIKARALADRLGQMWKPYVWENMGWHYAAITDSGFHMMEYDDRHRKYKDGFGRLYYSVTTGTIYSGKGDTPEEAIRDALDPIKSELDRLNGLYEHGLAALLNKEERPSKGPLENQQ